MKSLNFNKSPENVTTTDILRGLAFTPVGIFTMAAVAIAAFSPLAIYIKNQIQSRRSPATLDDVEAIIVTTRVEGNVPLVDDLSMLTP